MVISRSRLDKACRGREGGRDTHGDVRGTLDDEAVCEAVQADGAALLVQIDLLLRQEVGDPAAGTQPYEGEAETHTGE